jgi:L-lysine 6-transaminase
MDFQIVIDLDKSHGSYLFDAAHDRQLIDLYGFFGSNPVGFNHPHFDKPEVKADMLRAAKIKIANSDIYSEGYARFLDTFWRVWDAAARAHALDRRRRARDREYAQGRDGLESAQKHARWPRRARDGESCISVAPSTGRSGYTMSLTNTDPVKTDLFAKFNWPASLRLALISR